MFNKLTVIHDLFNTPLVARVANQVVFTRYNNVGQEFLFTLDKDGRTLVLPLNRGVPTTMLDADCRFIFLVRNKETEQTFTLINYGYAIKLLGKAPEFEGRDLLNEVGAILSDSFNSESLPKVDVKDPSNWEIFARLFQEQKNDVMSFFMAKSIFKYHSLIEQSIK